MSRTRNNLSNALVVGAVVGERIMSCLSAVFTFIEAIGEHLIGDEKVGYAALGFLFGFGLGAFLLTSSIFM